MPAAIPVTPDRPATVTGVRLLVVVPLPSSPTELSPQQCALPSRVTAHEE